MHLTYLVRCKRLCDFLIVGVDSDDLVRNNKGWPRPNIPEMHRQAMVDGLRCVNATFIVGRLGDLGEVVRESSADFLFKNSPTIYGQPTQTWGTQLVIVPDIEVHDSTSGIIESILKKGLTEVNR